MQLNTKQEFINYISLEHYCKKYLRTEYLQSWTVDIQMDVYKTQIQSGGSLDKIKLINVVRGDLHNKELVGDTWSPTSYMRNLKYFLSNATKHKARVHQLYFIGALL